MSAREFERDGEFGPTGEALALELVDEIMLDELMLAETGAIRRDPAYARWVQSSLNSNMNAGLIVDGIIGWRSRSAIRAFQRRAGLVADGVVGPITERALIAAGAPPPPPFGSPTFPGLVPGIVPVVSPPPAAPNRSTLRANIIAIALGAWELWGRGSIREDNPAMRPVLQDYWVTGTGAARREPNWWSSVPWSAAFISWVMRTAGAGVDFRYSAGHSTYISAAKQNRLAGNANPFKAFRVSEAAPRPGDLVCKSRAGSGATYDNITPGMATHCDVVVQAGAGGLATIGGNVSNSVSLTPVAVDANGFITAPGYFAVIRSGP